MNVQSKHISKIRKSKIKKSKKENKTIKTKIKIKSPDIIIEPPKTFFKKGEKFFYNISDILQKNTKNISKKIDKIFVCIYLIINDGNRINVSIPFLKYLLFKYNTNAKNINDTCIFPFVTTNNKNYNTNADSLVKQLLGTKITTDGFIEHKNNLFFFYNYTKKTNPIIYIPNKKRNIQLWWATIDEICNQKRIIHFPIHKSVTMLFISYPNLIYIKDANGSNFEIPITAYYGDYYKFIPIIATLGQKIANPKKAYDKFFYVTSYEKAIRYACWTSNYSSRYLDDKLITNEHGKYKKGNIIRFAVFMHKTYCQRNFLTEKELKKWKWNEKFDSLYVGRTKKNDGSFLSIFPRYIVKDFSQHIPLTVHDINPDKVPDVWDPNFDYKIE